jgi:uncharacterized membrane protein
MTWAQQYRIRHYIKSSLWVAPLTWVVLAILFHRMVWQFDLWARWKLLDCTPDGARAVVSTVTSSMLTFIVFLVGMLFIAVQLAQAQLTPRIISRVFQSRAARVSLSVFVFTYVFSASVQGRIGDPVPQLTVLITLVLSVVSIGVFLYLIGYAGTSIRPISIFARVGAEATLAIETLYPGRLKEPDGAPGNGAPLQDANPSATIRRCSKSGVFIAFDTGGLIEVASRHGCIIQLVPQVGDFVAEGDPIFYIYRGGEAIREKELMQSVAFGPERVIGQDPVFAFRIMVDIAIRALSPAINDPTTAVRGLDRIHHLLYLLGTRNLGDGRIRDRGGEMRLIFTTPNWEGFVRLGVSEIRMYGAGSLQVMRRLRAMLENLIEALPSHRNPPLREQLLLLDRSVERNFPDPEDRREAGICDFQGIGGSRVGRTVGGDRKRG